MMHLHKWIVGVGLLTAAFGSAQAMTLSSKDIGEGQQLSNQFVFNGFGCNGENLSPELTWSGAPKGTKAYAVTA